MSERTVEQLEGTLRSVLVPVADLAATVRDGFVEPPDRQGCVERAVAALDELVARATQAEAEAARLRELNTGLTRDYNALLVRSTNDEARLREQLDALAVANEAADETWRRVLAQAEAAEARCAQLEQTLRVLNLRSPASFGNTSEAVRDAWAVVDALAGPDTPAVCPCGHHADQHPIVWSIAGDATTRCQAEGCSCLDYDGPDLG